MSHFCIQVSFKLIHFLFPEIGYVFIEFQDAKSTKIEDFHKIGAAYIQSILVISKSKGLYETLRDIRTSTYQICGTEENN